ncbi:MAG: glycosyltransferase family 2 protein [Flavobacteriaceae bacterium]|nr:glycosyltransferase family 2 protein [Flavobacteriaceae bacterium]
MSQKICAIIVAYNPTYKKFHQLIKSLISQVNDIVVVNNGKDSLTFDFLKKSNVKLIQNEHNVGIAQAQNTGIIEAINIGCDFILTSDQDSEYPYDFTKIMIEELKNLSSNTLCIAPYFRDKNRSNKIEKSVSFNSNGFIFQNKNLIDCYVSHVISSGMLFKASAFEIIGKFDARFFIDYVDHDWCFRCASKNYKIFQTSKIIINHEIGDRPRKVFNKKLIIPSGQRVYYYLRNLFFMMIFKRYTFKIKLYIFKRYLIQLTKFILSEPKNTFKYLLKSLIDTFKMNRMNINEYLKINE